AECALSIYPFQKFASNAINRQNKVRVPVRWVQKNCRATGGHAIANAQRPRQPDRNVFSPLLIGERNRLAWTGAIFPVGDKVVLGDCSSKQLGGCMLDGFR